MSTKTFISDRVLWSSATLLCLSAALPVSAQDVRSQKDNFVLEEVVVTAQKRSEAAHDVPVSISVLGGEQLENLQATQLTDYAAYMPGFNISSAGGPGQTALTLRGVSSALSSTSTVGTYVDNSPLGSSGNWAAQSEFSLDLLPYDIERIEVLRGPQGTLYGSNTLGGLLKYVLRKPDTEQLELRVGGGGFTVESANDVGYDGRVSVNLPLAEGRAAVRASYFTHTAPGYIDNGLTGRKNQNDVRQDGGRLAVLFDMTEALSLTLAVMHQDTQSDDNAVAALDPVTLRPLLGEDLSNVNQVREPFDGKITHYSATVDGAFGGLDFVSASSYSRDDVRQAVDTSPIFGPLLGGGLTPSVFDRELKKLTQEFRLSSPADEHFEWLAGVFYTDEDVDNMQILNALDPTGAPIPGLDPLGVVDLTHKYQEYAAFANLTYKFTEHFDVTGGARWAKNDQDFHLITFGPFIGDLDLRQSSDEDVVTYAVSPRYHVNDDVMVYARVATGYRPGGPTGVPPIVPDLPNSFDSDSTRNYELGIKSAFLDRRVLFDLAAFYIDWSDIQVSVNQSGVSLPGNGGSATSQGFELTSAYSPIAGLKLGLNAAYTNSELASDVPDEGFLSGGRLPNIPRWSGSVTANYSFPLKGTWTGSAGLGYRYVGEQFSDISKKSFGPFAVRNPSYTVLDLNGGISSEHWTARLYVRNVTDERAYLSQSVVTDIFDTPVYVAGSVLQPRTVGLSVDFNF